MTDTNERIARGLGRDAGEGEHDWIYLEAQSTFACDRCYRSVAPVVVEHLGNGRIRYGNEPDCRWPCVPDVPDYEHSLDALLEPLGVLRERGWAWNVSSSAFGNYRALVTRVEPFKAIYNTDATPSEALALAVAEALEASK